MTQAGGVRSGSAGLVRVCLEPLRSPSYLLGWISTLDKAQGVLCNVLPRRFHVYRATSYEGPAFVVCVTLSQSQPLSGSQCPHLEKGAELISP